MLGDPHTVQNAAAPGFRIKPGRIDNFLRGDTGDLLHNVRGKLFNGFLQFFKTLGALFNKWFGMQAFFNDHMHQTVDPGHIGTQILPQPFIRISGNPDAPRIDHDELGAFKGHRPFDNTGQHRMIFSCIGSGN